MLNISQTSISSKIAKEEYKSFKKLENRHDSTFLIKVLAAIFIICILSLFLPWTQNIRSKGYVSTLNPYDKPQNIQALVGGQIKDWHVTEGDVVALGDTIVVLTEAKEDYLDPELLSNTKDQELAKSKSADAYLAKRRYLSEQLTALADNRQSKLKQLGIKQEQIDLETLSTEELLNAAMTYALNARKQLDRMQIMYDKGIKSLTDLESKTLSLREAEAKKMSYENKLRKLANEQTALMQEMEVVEADYQQKLSKVESDIQGADSYRYSLEGETSKLKSKYNQIARRQSAFVITSPINGRITKVLKNGIGEYVKSQESIATIVPMNYQRAVELYILPVDMPLMKEGKKVRLQFDGWPAVVFSGWPNNSFGTFAGEVFAIDNDISENGKYRILVTEDATEKAWPELIRIGSGVQGLLLLNDVRVYYEFWRKLNGFPPDFYEGVTTKDVKNKAPIKKFK